MKIRSVASGLLLLLALCLPNGINADFNATIDGFVFNQATGTFSCNLTTVSGDNVSSSPTGTFTVTQVGGTTSHVFFTATSSAAPYTITINGSTLVEHSDKTLPSSSMETTITKGRKSSKYTVVSSGSFTAADFSDLTMTSAGTGTLP